MCAIPTNIPDSEEEARQNSTQTNGTTTELPNTTDKITETQCSPLNGSIVSSSACVKFPPVHKSDLGESYSICFPINSDYPNMAECPDDESAPDKTNEYTNGFDYKSLFLFDENDPEKEEEKNEKEDKKENENKAVGRPKVMSKFERERAKRREKKRQKKMKVCSRYVRR